VLLALAILRPGSYDVDAAFMSFQPHESGIHIVLSGAGEVSVT
jgi:hypothetical protein